MQCFLSNEIMLLIIGLIRLMKFLYKKSWHGHIMSAIYDIVLAVTTNKDFSWFKNEFQERRTIMKHTMNTNHIATIDNRGMIVRRLYF